MKNQYKGLLIMRKENTNKLMFSRVSINRKSALEELYKILECDTIDIQERYINNKIYDFRFDDEYLINGKSQKAENIRAFATQKDQLIEIIFGNLFICGIANEKGEETDLNEEDINNILSAIEYIKNNNDNKNYQALKYSIEEQ